MICIDTNIVIYIAKRVLNENIVNNAPIIFPSVVQIEALGKPNIKSIEEQRIRGLFATLTGVPLTSKIIERAISLRQYKKMSLGDSVVAATALETGSVLWTANTKDFAHIEGLKLFNPLAKK